MIVRDVLSALRRRWWVLAACVLIGLVVSGASALLASNSYSSSARLLVATPQIPAGAVLPPGNLTPQEAATNYAGLATGSKIPQQVIDQLGLTLTLPDLLLQTRVSVLAGTTIIQITVVDPSASQAQRIAQAFATDLAAYAPTVGGGPNGSDAAPTITITDNANLPAVPIPSGGAASSLALGVIAGAVVGAALIWLLEFLDHRIRRAETLRDAAGAPVLTTIAGGIADGPDALLRAGRTDNAEGYRALRTALLFVDDIDAAAPIFVITAAQSGVGDAAVAANAAMSMAQADQRVLLVDANLHQPELATLLGLDGRQPGLTEVLAGSAAVADATQRWVDGNLDVIAAGASATLPTEQVQSKAMDALLTKFRAQYDVIILSTPALDMVTDGALLAAAGDGAVLVAREGKTTEDQVRRAVQRLEMVRARLFGCVLLGGRDTGTQLPYPPLGLGEGSQVELG